MIVTRPVGVRDAIAEFPALVDTARGFRSCMAADPARKAELPEEALHAGKIFTLVRIDFRVRSFKVRIRQDGRRAVPRTRNEDRIQVILLYQSIKMNVGEALAGVRAPVAQQARLGLLELQRLAQQRGFLHLKHPPTPVEGRPPIALHLARFIATERRPLTRRPTPPPQGPRESCRARDVTAAAGRVTQPQVCHGYVECYSMVAPDQRAPRRGMPNNDRR